MSRSFDLDPVESIAVGTVGPPGRRQFFLRAAGGAENVVFNCEKAHVQGLIAAIRQRLEDPGASEQPADPAARPAETEAAEPGASEWTIGELGLGYHESRRMFVIVAREAPTLEEAGGEDEPSAEEAAPELATARLWAAPDLLRRFAGQAEAVVASGRPVCPHCGLPVDPTGHPCPAANGSRPVL